MAHTKAGGSTRQKGNRKGQRLGVKKFGGNSVINGNILIRQKGSTVLSGEGTKMARNFNIYSIRDGVVKFITRKGRKYLTVQPA